MPQMSVFNATGGFVLHKLMIGSSNSARYSAWYDASGTLLDCEMIRADGVAYAVPARCSMIRDALAFEGKRYAPLAAATPRSGNHYSTELSILS